MGVQAFVGKAFATVSDRIDREGLGQHWSLSGWLVIVRRGVEKPGVRVRSLIGGFSDVANGLCVALHVARHVWDGALLSNVNLRFF
jgi:hypothetical protein